MYIVWANRHTCTIRSMARGHYHWKAVSTLHHHGWDQVSVWDDHMWLLSPPLWQLEDCLWWPKEVTQHSLFCMKHLSLLAHSHPDSDSPVCPKAHACMFNSSAWLSLAFFFDSNKQSKRQIYLALHTMHFIHLNCSWKVFNWAKHTVHIHWIDWRIVYIMTHAILWCDLHLHRSWKLV